MEQRFLQLSGMFENPGLPFPLPLPQPLPKSLPLPKFVEGSGTLTSGTGMAVADLVRAAMILAMDEDGADGLCLTARFISRLGVLGLSLAFEAPAWSMGAR